MKGIYYFYPTAGSSIVTYTESTSSWGSIDISSSPVAKISKGVSFVAVPAASPAFDDFLVVSGGGSKQVAAYSIQKKTWKVLPGLSNSISNNCAVGCDGYWLTMDGDISGGGSRRRKMTVEGLLEDGQVPVGKPANRQVYRYNVTSGETQVNNGEKSRGGAGCGCADDRAFWAGGYSNSGLSADVETWGVMPGLHRGGEPSFSTKTARRDVGAATCGGTFVVAGGTSGKSGLNSIDVFNASSTTGGSPMAVYTMEDGLTMPRVACLNDQYAIISGGMAGKSVNNKVYFIDTKAAIFAKAAVTLSTTGEVAVASDGTGPAMFFDGTTGTILSTGK